MMGQAKTYQAKPWFWSDQYDTTLQIAGLNTGYGSVITREGERVSAEPRSGILRIQSSLQWTQPMIHAPICLAKDGLRRASRLLPRMSRTPMWT